MTDTSLIRGFSFGGVVGGSFGVFARNLIPFIFLSLVMTLPTFLYDLYGPQPRTQSDQTLYEAIANIINFVCTTLLSAALVYGTVQELRGRHASLGASISRGLGVVLPALGVSLVVGIGIAVGTLLFIIPGLILATMWWVAVPVTVVERPGVFASIGRSAELTKGFRWPIFGINVLIAVVSLGIVFVLGFVLGQMVYRGSMSVIAFYIVIWIATGVISAFTSVIAGVGYFALRAEKEGADIDQIAAVFD